MPTLAIKDYVNKTGLVSTANAIITVDTPNRKIIFKRRVPITSYIDGNLTGSIFLEESNFRGILKIDLLNSAYEKTLLNQPLVGAFDGANKKYTTKFTPIIESGFSLKDSIGNIINPSLYTVLFDKHDNRFVGASDWENTFADSTFSMPSMSAIPISHYGDKGKILEFKVGDITRLHGVKSIYNSLTTYSGWDLEVKDFGSSVWTKVAGNYRSGTGTTNWVYTETTPYNWENAEYVRFITTYNTTGNNFSIGAVVLNNSLDTSIIEFIDAPTNTVFSDYKVHGLPKDENYVTDVTFELIFGEGA